MSGENWIGYERGKRDARENSPSLAQRFAKLNLQSFPVITALVAVIHREGAGFIGLMLMGFGRCA